MPRPVLEMRRRKRPHKHHNPPSPLVHVLKSCFEYFPDGEGCAEVFDVWFAAEYAAGEVAGLVEVDGAEEPLAVGENGVVHVGYVLGPVWV
nr:hypothetical protein Iba_chr05dCG5780 [Ipomoea batatas]